MSGTAKIFNKCTVYNIREPHRKTLKGDFAKSPRGLFLIESTQVRWPGGRAESQER
jgi:hypothetical protein